MIYGRAAAVLRGRLCRLHSGAAAGHKLGSGFGHLHRAGRLWRRRRRRRRRRRQQLHRLIGCRRLLGQWRNCPSCAVAWAGRVGVVEGRRVVAGAGGHGLVERRRLVAGGCCCVHKDHCGVVMYSGGALVGSCSRSICCAAGSQQAGRQHRRERCSAREKLAHTAIKPFRAFLKFPTTARSSADGWSLCAPASL